MKKDMVWLNNELEKVIKTVESDDIYFAGKSDYDEGYIDGIRDVQPIINQLDEPEVLSQDWITENSVEGDFRGVQEFWYGEFIEKEKLQNLLVPKQELPVIPQFVADWITAMHNGGLDLYPALKRLESNALIWEDVFKWYRENTCSFVNAYLTREYKVGEEQRYIVSDNSSIPLLIKNDSGEIVSYDSQIAYNNSNGTIELTEQEIKDYDKRYMAFAKPVGEMEE